MASAWLHHSLIVHLVTSESLRPHVVHHARLLCPSLSLEVCSDSCPLSCWCHPTVSSCRLLLLLPSFFPSIGIFPNESVLRIRWPKYWSFSFSISPSNEYSRLMSFRMGWLDLLAVQGTLKNLLQHHSLKASIFWRSPFFMVQLLHAYVTTGKTIALTVDASNKEARWEAWVISWLRWCRQRTAPAHGSSMYTSTRLLLRSRITCGQIHWKRFIMRGGPRGWWWLRSPMTCQLQGGGPRKLVLWF